MHSLNKDQGFTVIGVSVAFLLLAIALILALNYYSNAGRASTEWVQGKFKLVPQNVRQAPASASFVFAVTHGTGVDQNGQPVGSGVALASRELEFELIGSGGDSGFIQTLNTTTFNSPVGSQSTDLAGIIAISIQVSDDGPYILKVTDVSNGTEERLFFTADP